MTQTPISCSAMRGGTSKGLFFLKDDLPADTATRDAVLLAAMGSPDERQIDGMGGAHPLTSKIAVVGPPTHPDADVDYLFLQVVVDKAEVSDSQNCGNMLAGVGPFAITRGLIKPTGDITEVRIHMLNTKSLAVAAIQTPGGKVRYDGDARIDGVPGTAAPIPIDFLDVAGSSCGALLPTGNARDVVEGVEVTCIDNGMPVVVMRASDFGQTGYESPEEMEANAELKARVEQVRLAVGSMMNLGDVTKKTVPKMCLVAPAQHGGAICTRNFIPHRVHEAIGVFGAVSVATACVVPGSIAAEVAGITDIEGSKTLDVEHPTGFFSVAMDVSLENGEVKVRRSALLRTARMLMSGEVYVPAKVWGRPVKIALIGFGEVGQILGKDLEAHQLSAWDGLFPNPDSKPSRALPQFKVRAGASAPDAVADADLVISAVTAANDREAAAAAAPGMKRGAFFVDFNSASPGMKQASADVIEAAGGRYVEGAVMTPFPPKRLGSAILLGGPHAKDFLPVAQSVGLTGTSVFSERLGAASATKMCRSVMIKGVEALCTESMLAARHYGVEDAVLNSLSDLLPVGDWHALARYMISRSLEHGVRRAEEMREAARTVEEAGVEPLMSRAIAERQDWAAGRGGDIGYDDLAAMLDAVLGDKT